MELVEKDALLDQKPRVLYLHGFEETRHSPKPAALLADPNLVVQMPHLGVYFSHRNSPLVSLAVVTLPFSVPAAILTSILPVVLLINPFFWALASTVLTASLYMLRHHLISRSIGRSFDRSYEVARSALVAFKPHAVVGFSWGGALAVRLSNDGAYDGPMLLLAPAHAAIERMMHRPVSCPRLGDSSCVRIIHGNLDRIVPLADSQALSGLGVHLEVVEADHKLWDVAPQLSERVLRLLAPRRASDADAAS